MRLSAFSFLIIIFTKSLKYVVEVGDALGALGLVIVPLALSEELLAGNLVSLHHLDGKDVNDLNAMSRDAVVQEVGREHHVVALVPELGVILVAEGKDITSADEAETSSPP